MLTSSCAEQKENKSKKIIISFFMIPPLFEF